MQLRALVIMVVLVAAAGPSQARSLQVAGTAGYVSEWELNAEVTQTSSGVVKEEYSGPLTLKHVGLCSHNGPQEESGEIKFQISESGSLSKIQATLLYEGARCTYSGTLSDSSSHGFMRCNTEGIPLTLSVK
jgi:hypothetical protein